MFLHAHLLQLRLLSLRSKAKKSVAFSCARQCWCSKRFVQEPTHCRCWRPITSRRLPMANNHRAAAFNTITRVWKWKTNQTNVSFTTCCASSTPHGGGGWWKFQRWGTTGEVKCCDALKAERIHWWTETWLELFLLKWLQRLQWSPHPQLLDVVCCTAVVTVPVA